MHPISGEKKEEAEKKERGGEQRSRGKEGAGEQETFRKGRRKVPGREEEEGGRRSILEFVMHFFGRPRERERRLSAHETKYDRRKKKKEK